MEESAYYNGHPDGLEKIQDKFVAFTEGFSFTEINGLRRLCRDEKIRNAKADFENRVKGQDYAITKTLDVIKRAITGMPGLQGSSHTRPKGVLFFAGPTGTGKTETAKTLAEILFGDESCCRCFDMSEYGQSHINQKLLGAPPGYVGYDHIYKQPCYLHNE